MVRDQLDHNPPCHIAAGCPNAERLGMLTMKGLRGSLPNMMTLAMTKSSAGRRDVRRVPRAGFTDKDNQIQMREIIR
jgi:hypothetical protein